MMSGAASTCNVPQRPSTCSSSSKRHSDYRSKNETYAGSLMNLALLDPPRWGWPALGAVTDLLTPHERARRKESKRACLKAKKKKREKACHAGKTKTVSDSMSPPRPPAISIASRRVQGREQEGAVYAHAMVAPSGSGGEEATLEGASTCTEATGAVTLAPRLRRSETEQSASGNTLDGRVAKKIEPAFNRDTENAAESKYNPDQSNVESPKMQPPANPPDASPLPKDLELSKPGKLCDEHYEQMPPSDTIIPEYLKSSEDKQHSEKKNIRDGENHSAMGSKSKTKTVVAVNEPVDANASMGFPKQSDRTPDCGENSEPNNDSNKDRLELKEPIATSMLAGEKSNDATNFTTEAASTTSIEKAELEAKKRVQLSQQQAEVQPAGETNSTAAEKRRLDHGLFLPEGDPTLNVAKTAALRALDGSLDIYAYHRGIEGLEPRDLTSGELVCDVEESDTNFKRDEPKMTLQVNISFPLTGEKDSAAENSRMFEDTIYWNLGDPETQTPMVFAAATSENFELSFGQTVDLAMSIQEQIDCHVWDHCGYAVPVAMTDGSGMERIQQPQATVPWLYGDTSHNSFMGPGRVRSLAALPSTKSKAWKGSANRALPAWSQGGTSNRRGPQSDASAFFGGSISRGLPGVEYNEVVEAIYIQEVLKRMTECSRADLIRKAAESGHPPGFVELKENWVCHICHKRAAIGGQFSCGKNSHSYCASHLRQRLSLPVTRHSDNVTFDHCPICAVTCKCSKCIRRLNALGVDLKRLSEEQEVPPESANFESIFTCYTKPSTAARIFKSTVTAKRRFSNESSAIEITRDAPECEPKKKKQKGAPKKGKEGRSTLLPAVPKTPASEFPGEFRGSLNLEPGTSTDYLTIYTSEGLYVKDPSEMPAAVNKRTRKPDDIIEDGNFSLCSKCSKAGELVCCDFCPRAFHANCLETDASSDESKWQCLVCRAEREGLAEYELTGTASQAAICSAYCDLRSSHDDDLTELALLSKIHEMIGKLMESDFGFLFAEPVDSKANPDYPNMIRQPMDLGTIGSKLVNGGYKECFAANKSWSDIHLGLLKDIERVWHNCFTFNVEGSAVYRSAQVLRRRMLGMKSRSLDKDLHPDVKKEIDAFVRDCEHDRGKMTAQIDMRPVPKHRISIKSQNTGPCRRMAVYDPDTGMVVKHYSTIKSAIVAAEFLASRGHESELKTVSDNTIRPLFGRSAQDPSATLFGYRWLEFEKLRDGKVAFAPLPTNSLPTPTVFAMVDGESTYIFFSMEEVLSFPGLPKDCLRDGLQQALEGLSEGGDGSTVSGIEWRLLTSKQSEKSKSTASSVSVAALWAVGGEQGQQQKYVYLPESVNVVKEDVILRRVVAGFTSFDAAYADWVMSCKSCSTIPLEETSQSRFHTYYLDGDRNIDGLMWKTIEKALPKAVASGEVSRDEENTTLPDNWCGDPAPTEVPP